MKTVVWKRVTAGFLVVVMVMSLVLATPGLSKTVEAAPKKYVKSLSVKKSVSVQVGKKVTVKPKVKVVKKASKKVKVKVKNKKIATVSYSSKTNKITIKGKKVGKTTVTVTTVGKNKKGKKITKKMTVKVTKKKNSKPITEESTTQASTTEEATTEVSTTEEATTETAITPVVPNVPVTPEPEEILVSQVVLSSNKISLVKGDKIALSASVLPTTATNKAVTWSCSSDEVLSMSENNNGVDIIARQVGSVIVKATAKDGSGKSALCEIEVKDIAEVSTQEELERLLKVGMSQITLNAVAGQSYVLSGDYENTSIIINGTGATITNNATFFNINLNGGNYTENAVGNNIIASGAANITVSEDAQVNMIDINIPGGSKENETDAVIITNVGVISSLNVLSGGIVTIKGDSKSSIVVNISGENAKLVVNQVVDITLTAKAELVFRGTGQGEEGSAAQSTITADVPDNTPDIYGVGQYEINYKDGSESKIVLSQVSDDIAPVEELYGRVLDAFASGENAGIGLGGVSVYLIPANEYHDGKITIDEEEMIVNSTDENTEIRLVTTDESGDYSFGETESGNYYIIMLKENYKKAIQFLAISSDYDITCENETMEMLLAETAKDIFGCVKGTVTNAATAKGIANLTVELRLNKGIIAGQTVATTTTDADGNYELNVDGGLEADQYTICVVDNRGNANDKYISKTANVCVKTTDATQRNVITSASLSEEGLRFVLSWGSEATGAPSDLDAHLFGPRMIEDGMFHVYYSAQKYGVNGGEVYTQLDVDDKDWVGPETITVDIPTDGTYYYYVYNYAYDEKGEGSFAVSDAKVDVYKGDKLLTTYNVPNVANSTEAWWKVCGYNVKTKRLISYNTLVEDCEYENSAYSGLESLIDVMSTTEDYTVTHSIHGNNLELRGNATWSLLRDTLQFNVLSGYTAEFQDAAEASSDGLMGQVIIKKDGLVITTYNVFYYVNDELYTFTFNDENIKNYSVVDKQLNLKGIVDWGSINKNALTVSSNIYGLDATAEWYTGETDGFVGRIILKETDVANVYATINVAYESIAGTVYNVTCSDTSKLLGAIIDGLNIEMTGIAEWSDIKELLSYTVDEGYTTTYSDSENEAYVSVLNVMNGSTVVKQYNISYRHIPIVAIANQDEYGITQMDLQFVNGVGELYLYCSGTVDLSSIQYTSSKEGYTCTYSYDEENKSHQVTLVNESDDAETYTYYLYTYLGRYVVNIGGEGLVHWEEYKLDLDLYCDSELYTDDATFIAGLEITCIPGYIATIEDYVLTIKDVDGNVVKDENGNPIQKEIYVYEY